MNEAELFLAVLIKDGVRVSVNGENLKIEAPGGILTPKSKTRLGIFKPQIISCLIRYGNYETFYEHFAEKYNKKLEQVLNNKNLFDDFNDLLDERVAIMEFDGNLSLDEAEKAATETEFVMQLVLSV